MLCDLPPEPGLSSGKIAVQCVMVLRFLLLVFHIITSCSALGVKELVLQFWAPVWKRKITKFPRGL